MSLDVHLTLKDKQPTSGSGIFIRENGETREISRAEWDLKFPGTEPLTIDSQESNEVYWANITHNLNNMAKDAGIYEALWRPEEIGISKAGQLVEPLTQGLALLKSDPARFEKFNPSNGWGSYDALVRFVEKYLAACVEYPQAEVYASR